jgi:hypothetical protein
MKHIYIIITLIVLVATSLLSGCASYELRRDSSGAVIGVDSQGFLRTIVFEQEYEYEYGPNGERRIKKHKIKVATDSNTGEAAKAANQLIGTTVGAARDLMP